SAASPERAPRARSRSMPTAPTSVTRRAPSTGDTPARSPRATPARATWARVSAISESRRGTRKTPMAGQMSAVMAPAATAGCRKPGARNPGMLGRRGRPASVLVGDHAHRRAVQRGEGGVAEEIAGAAVEDQAPVQAGELGDLLGDHADVVA